MPCVKSGLFVSLVERGEFFIPDASHAFESPTPAVAHSLVVVLAREVLTDEVACYTFGSSTLIFDGLNLSDVIASDVVPFLVDL